jgi:hypothetical protein
MEWLNQNAGAIQAIAAIVSLIVTFVLVVITGRYVRLTRTLAESANAQVRAQAEARDTRRHDLAANIGVLQRALASIPAGNVPNVEQRIRNSIDWSDFDFGHFRTLASEVSRPAAHAAAEIESDMGRLQAIIAEIKSTPLGRGYDWSRFPWAEWELIMHRKLQRAISTLLEETSRRLSTDMRSGNYP